MMEKKHNALRHLKKTLKDFPNIIIAMQKARGDAKHLESWQFLPEKTGIELCLLYYCKRNTLLKFLESEAKEQEKQDLLNSIEDYFRLALPVLVWNQTKGIYCFDQDAFEAISDTEISSTIPAEIFLQMPEWCIYVETP